MAAPTPYELAYDFTAFQTSNPTTPLPADKVEIEFNAIALTTDEIIANLGLIQRSDGELANGSVGEDQLSAGILAILGAGTGEISTLAALDTEISALYAIRANITTVAGISANVTTVAGIDDEVTTVAGMSSAITTVNANATNINTVAGVSASVTAVAGIQANVTTVAGIDTEVTIVAGIAAKVSTVAGISAAVDALGDIAADITTVAGMNTSHLSSVAGVAAEVAVVAGISANVTTVAGIDSEITTVAGLNTEIAALGPISAAISAVAAVDTEITTLAALDTEIAALGAVAPHIQTVSVISASVTTVAGGLTNINTVADSVNDVEIVAANISKITTVAAINDEIITVAGISANVTAVADIDNEVVTVAGIAADISQVADEIVTALRWTYDDATAMDDPGVGLLRLNHATEASVTAIAIDDQTSQTGNPNLAAYVLTWDDSDSVVKGSLKLTKTNDPTIFAIYDITGLTDNSGWAELAVNYVTGAGSFTDADDLFVSFSRAGDKGASGAGAGDVLVSGTPVDNQIAIWTTADTIEGVAALTFDGTALALTGNFTVSGTVDGRDVAADGTKLDGIEASADVTDTANVTSAGALMDSEVASLSGIKTLTVPDSTTITAFAATMLDDTTQGAVQTTLGLGTGNSPQFANINLGHASDTTLARVSAGVVSIEGNNILTANLIGSSVQAYSSVLQNTTASFTSSDETKLDHITVTQAVDLDAMESRLAALDAVVILKGSWDASAGTFPGSGTAQAGESWIVSVAGTVDSTAFNINDRIIAVADNASTSTFAANWFKADYTDQVLTVAGRTGAVVIAQADVTGLTTADSPQFTGINLGHASDTTFTRVSAGVAAIEGNNILTANLIGSSVQAYSARLVDIAALAITDSNIIVGNGSTWVAESGATARTSLGVGTGDTVQFTAINLGHASDTTIARVSAGVVSIEGSNILLASGLGSITQAYDADLAAIAGLTSAADKGIQFTGAGTAGLFDLTAFAKTILDDANAAAVLTTLGLAGIGYEVGQFTATYTGAVTGTTTADYVKVGKQITVHLPQKSTAGASSASPVNVAGLPYAPVAQFYKFDIQTIDNGNAQVTEPGAFRVTGGGSIIIYKDMDLNNFTSSANNTGHQGYCFTYMTA
jgi:hypothetical protein